MRHKSLLIALLIMMSTISVYSQMETVNVKWKDIEKKVNSEPEMVRGLINRLCDYDTTMTMEERALAFYGNALMVNTLKSEYISDNGWRLLKKEIYPDALEMAKKALEVNRLSPTALNLAATAISKMIDAGDTSSLLLAEGQEYYNRFLLTLYIIATTGDGSKEHPFVVIEVSDEYNFMRFLLDLWDYDSQSVVDGRLDKFELAKTSEFYDSPTIYFDVSRHLQKLEEIFR